jgi:hypothetical protein
MNLRRGRKPAALAALTAVLALGVVAGCGEEETSHVVEGEPIELGDLRFNVAITRFLNPDDVEDAEYLEGLPPPAPGHDYLAVFLDVENEGDEDATLPTAEQIEIKDTTGEHFEPIETESLFALELGAPIEAGAEVPEEDTAARSGPVQGSFILFELPVEAESNRPLELELTADGEDGTIELDL